MHSASSGLDAWAAGTACGWAFTPPASMRITMNRSE